MKANRNTVFSVNNLQRSGLELPERLAPLGVLEAHLRVPQILSNITDYIVPRCLRGDLNWTPNVSRGASLSEVIFSRKFFFSVCGGLFIKRGGKQGGIDAFALTILARFEHFLSAGSHSRQTTI